jgi:hypothetical protein
MKWCLYLILDEFEVFITHNATICLSLVVPSGDVAEFTGFFLTDWCGWPLIKWLATIRLLLHVSLVFDFILVFGCFLLVALNCEYATLIALDLLLLLILIFQVF